MVVNLQRKYRDGVSIYAFQSGSHRANEIAARWERAAKKTRHQKDMIQLAIAYSSEGFAQALSPGVFIVLIIHPA